MLLVHRGRRYGRGRGAGGHQTPLPSCFCISARQVELPSCARKLAGKTTEMRWTALHCNAPTTKHQGILVGYLAGWFPRPTFASPPRVMIVMLRMGRVQSFAVSSFVPSTFVLILPIYTLIYYSTLSYAEMHLRSCTMLYSTVLRFTIPHFILG